MSNQLVPPPTSLPCDGGRIVLRGLFESFTPDALGRFVQLLPGVTMLPLYGRHADGREVSPGMPSAAILRYEPGAVVPRHLHAGFEHIIVLDGSQSDENGTYERGACLISPPGSQHRVNSDHGCLVLAIWQRSVEFLGETDPHDDSSTTHSGSNHKPCLELSTATQNL